MRLRERGRDTQQRKGERLGEREGERESSRVCLSRGHSLAHALVTPSMKADLMPVRHRAKRLERPIEDVTSDVEP